MKKIFLLILICSILTPLAISQEITEEDIVIAGITPDSPIYFLEMIFERFTELFGEEIKIAHAQERLAEIKVMIAENNIKASQVAIRSFENLRKRIRNKERIEEHRQLIENLGIKISSIVSKGVLNETDRIEMREFIEEHRERILNESVKIISEGRNVNLEQAQELFNQERLKIQQKVTDRIREIVRLNQNLANQNGNV